MQTVMILLWLLNDTTVASLFSLSLSVTFDKYFQVSSEVKKIPFNKHKISGGGLYRRLLEEFRQECLQPTEICVTKDAAANALNSILSDYVLQKVWEGTVCRQKETKLHIGVCGCVFCRCFLGLVHLFDFWFLARLLFVVVVVVSVFDFSFFAPMHLLCGLWVVCVWVVCKRSNDSCSFSGE